MITDDLSLTGHVVVRLNDEIVQEVDNLVVTAGKNYVASRMKDATATAMSHMAVGSSNTAAAANQTALVTEVARVALTSTTVTAADVVYVGTYGSGTGTGTLNEAGILNAASGGTMLARVVFSGAISKGANDSMTITWTVTAG
ncbi:MAG: hypothetical protein CL885_03795 [Dehalococcoidia bacterium]|nr:hypothetical protein [Dehalococcoidia bacterium]